MKIALLADTHFGVRNDSKSILDHQEKFFSRCFFPYLKKNDISQIIHLGDIYDKRKGLNYVTYDRVKKFFLEPLKDFETEAIVGNHDVYYRTTNSINSVRLLMEEMNSFRFHEHSPVISEYDGLKIGLMPWITADNAEESGKFLASGKADMILGHFEIAGFAYYRGNIAKHGMSPKEFKKYKLVCSGHFHHKSNEGNIHYLGSPYAMTWADYGDPRGFHVLDTSDMSLEFIQNPFELFRKLEYDDELMGEKELKEMIDSVDEGGYTRLVVKNKTKMALFEEMMSNLESKDQADLRIDDQQEIDTGDDEMEEVGELLDFLKDSVDNEDVRDILVDVYKEALSR